MQHFFRHFRFDNYTIKDFLNETTYDFEEVFGSYAYNGYGAELASTSWFSGYRSACTDFSVFQKWTGQRSKPSATANAFRLRQGCNPVLIASLVVYGSTSTTMRLTGKWILTGYLGMDTTCTYMIPMRLWLVSTPLTSRPHWELKFPSAETEQDNNFLEYIYVEANEDIRLYLRYQKFHRVHTHENPCVDPTEHPSYSRSRVINNIKNLKMYI